MKRIGLFSPAHQRKIDQERTLADTMAEVRLAIAERESLVRQERAVAAHLHPRRLIDVSDVVPIEAAPSYRKTRNVNAAPVAWDDGAA